jgi:DNA uptake protein ComE-like DNA-binding protein
MNQIVSDNTSSRTVATSLARISEPHGYRFDGDIVHLHARFAVLDPAAHQREWTLQLWACPEAPAPTGVLKGHMVAQVALPPMSESADESEHMDMTAFATPPAGNAEHFMALVLAAGRRPGQADEVHDVAVYSRRQQFLQPGIMGTVGYRIAGNRVHLSVERIENPRAAGNVSGTLALELWALAAPYSGAAFNGAPLAGVAFGSLPGEAATTAASFELLFVPPPAGQWHFVLMLREWTSAGYVTRDFTNFRNPVSHGATPASAPRSATPAIASPTVPPKTASPSVIPRTASPSAAAAAPQRSATPTPAPSSATLAIVTKEAPSAPKKQAEPPRITTVAPAVRADATKAVSVNTAAEGELSAVTGLTAQMARGIVSKRPFTSLDDLRRVKGISLKVLDQIRSRLSL